MWNAAAIPGLALAAAAVWRLLSEIWGITNLKVAPLPNEPPLARIEFLDGLRGLAIFTVILYHAFVRWPQLYVYGAKFSGSPIFDTDIAGVNLFFIISGFVILMTLRKCADFSDFIIRRWYRLFPAMLLCSVFILLTSGLFPERPQGNIHFLDLLPGVTFIGDGYGVNRLWDWLSAGHGFHVVSVEGAFWSLYVEVRFYIIFGLAYFVLGERASVTLIILLFLFSKLSSETLLNLHFGPHDIGGHILATMHELASVIGIDSLNNFLNSRSYGFFATGALFFLFHVTRDRRLFCLGLAIGLLSVGIAAPIANLVLTLLFVLAMSSKAVRRILSSKPLVFLGFISYPLYLLHENMLVAMIVKIGRAAPNMAALLIPVLPFFVVCGLAFVVARYIEPAMRDLIHKMVKVLRTNIAPRLNRSVLPFR